MLAHERTVEALHDPPEWFVFVEESKHHGVVVQKSREMTILHGHIDQRVDQHRPGSLRRGLGLGESGYLAQPVEYESAHGKYDLVLGSKLMIDGRLGDADGIRDHLQGRTGRAALAEQANCGIENPGLGNA